MLKVTADTQDQQLSAVPSALEWCGHAVKAKDEEENPQNKPRPRACHTLTVVGTNAFMFGGMVGWTSDPDVPLADIPDDEMAKPSDELFKLELSNKNGMEWSLVKTNVTNVGGNKAALSKPSARWRHTATLFDTSNILIFGGFQTSDHRLNDVWVFDTISLTWSQPNVLLQFLR